MVSPFSRVKCPSCGRRLQIASVEAGIKVSCPACNAPFTLGSRVAGGAAGDFIAFELFDPDIALDDIAVTLLDAPKPTAIAPPKEAPKQPPPPVTKSAQGPLVKAGDTEHPVGQPVDKKDKRKRRRGNVDFLEELDEEQREALFGGPDYGEPKYYRAWQMVHWGLTLVLFSVLMYFAAFALIFISLAMFVASEATGGAEGAAAGLGMLGIAIMVLVGTEALRLVGYGFCLAVPGKTSARSYVWIALGMAVASLLGEIVRVVFEFLEPTVAANIIAAIAVVIGFISYMSFMMFMETIADMNNERGIADSVSNLIKLAGIFGMASAIGMSLQVGMRIWIATGEAPKWMQPGGGDASLYVVEAASSCYSAFVGILGLVVFIKYILAVLNVRRVVEQNL